MNETTREKFEQRRLAVHEAGHAVMHLILGIPFEKVSLHGEKMSGYVIRDGQKVSATAITGGGVFTDPTRIDEIDRATLNGILHMREALISMAGPVAEEMLIGKIDDQLRCGSMIDMGAIVMCCRAALNQSSRQETWSSIQEMEAKLVDAFAIGAKNLLRGHLKSLKAVTEALLMKGTLTYSEASETFKIAQADDLTNRNERK